LRSEEYRREWIRNVVDVDSTGDDAVIRLGAESVVPDDRDCELVSALVRCQLHGRRIRRQIDRSETISDHEPNSTARGQVLDRADSGVETRDL
jgi:hypothetical protein